MIIDRSGFLLMAGVLGAGGVAGWAIRDRSAAAERLAAAPPAPVNTVPAIAAPVPSVVVVDPKAAAPACDDSVGAPEECPSVGPSDEGVCANVIFKRCGDYKAAFKPRVAQAAVACLRALQGAERCDPARVNLCGHAALMTACPEPPAPAKGTYLAATGTTPATLTLTEDPAVMRSPVLASCETMLKSCSGQPLSPSLADCRQTLIGMNDSGRATTLECVAAHCKDRGLLGCEAMQKAAVPSQAQR